jgi:hypothetical protein
MGSRTKRDPSVTTVTCGEPFDVGVTPTDDGEKVIVVLRRGQEDQTIYWLETSDAIKLAEALIVTACTIEDERKDGSPPKN